MKKLTTLFAALALTAAITGCKKKDGATDNAPKTEEKAGDDKMAKPDDKAAKPDDKMAKPDDKAAKPDDKAAPAAATGDMPKECADYKAAVEKLASCDKLPQATRDAMKTAFDGMATSLAGLKDMPAESKKAFTDSCKAGADGVMTTAKAVCGW